MLFKVGDFVKIRKDSKYYLGTPRNPVGQVGFIHKVDIGNLHCYRVTWYYSGSRPVVNSYREQDLELSNQENSYSISMNPKIGDVVITSGYSKDYNGRELTITNINDDGFCYFSVNDGGYYDASHNFHTRHIATVVNKHDSYSIY